jgi:hypothetical protein
MLKVRSVEGACAEREELRSWDIEQKKGKNGNSQVRGNEAVTTETEIETGICSIFQTYLDNKIIAFLSNPQVILSNGFLPQTNKRLTYLF